jgi:hypothetical protein
MGGQFKTKASSLSSAVVRQLWQEPTEETGPNPACAAILAANGGQDVNRIPTANPRGKNGLS